VNICTDGQCRLDLTHSLERFAVNYVLTVTCPSRRGIVAAISGCLADNGCNITDSAQFHSETGATLAELRESFATAAGGFDMEWAIHDATHRMKVLLMVSNFGHCLNDILYRRRVGTLPIDIVGVVSNHLTYQKTVVNHDIPFHHIKVKKDSKPEAEARLMALVEETSAELVVLARYMQILSDAVCRTMKGRVINIHHSFLPSFKGANPYKQAYERGVKLIGATAHYVTADLDEGPIIEQDTVRITHAQYPDDYVSIGRDVEAQVLARAIHAHIHHRVFQNGNRTIVFPPSPGSYASTRVG
jgi:formyltetrahydrofolate deformylase